LALADAFRGPGSPSFLPVPRRAVALTVCLAAAIAWAVYRLARRDRRRRERVEAQQRDDGLELVRTPGGPG
jgi:hypothetical protein